MSDAFFLINGPLGDHENKKDDNGCNTDGGKKNNSKYPAGCGTLILVPVILVCLGCYLI